MVRFFGGGLFGGGQDAEHGFQSLSRSAFSLPHNRVKIAANPMSIVGRNVVPLCVL